MLNFYKFIEIVICLQSLVVSTMIPVFIVFPFAGRFNYSLEMPISWQIPTTILLTLFFKRKIVLIAFTFYLLLGLFLIPIFHQGGSLGYLITPNFGYLIGLYPLIEIINFSNKKNKIFIKDFLKNGILAIIAMHITGITYSILQIFYYKQINIFLYNIGNYSLGKIGYHLLMLIPLLILIKPINYLRYK